MDYPQTLPPAAQRVLAGVLKVAPKAVVRQMLRNMSTGDASGPLSRFDADRLAREAPTAAILARPAVDPTRWPDPNKQPASAGPLQGATVIVKESLDVAGLPQSLGNHGAQGPIATKDSVLVARIRKAGGKLLGKSIMTELGMDGVGVHLENGVPDNPRVKGHFPGGSSTGTAVLVASGQARFGVGGDGLGSVRIPSGFCGLVGLKPTHGRLSVVGMQRDAPTLAVPGPMTRNATDCALLWAVLDGHKPTRLRPLWPKSIGVMNQLPPSLASTDVRGAFDRALALLGCPEVKVDVEGAGSSTTLAFMSAAYETARSPWAKLAQEPTPQLVLAMGQRLDEKDSGWTKTQRKKLRDVFLKALDRAGGFILSPTTAIPAPAIDKQLLKGGMNLALLRAVGCYAPLANVTGVPAIAIPCGVDARGRPLSVQVFGKPDSEGDLLRIARAFEVI